MCDSKKASDPASAGFFFSASGTKGARPGLGSASAPDTLAAMLWVKSLHIVFVTSWFAGLFYLPRIYVNLAMVPPESVAERARLLGMARRLMRFMTMLAVPALALGLWLWLGYGIGRGPGNGWMHAKLAIVVLLVAYHVACGVLLRHFETGANRRSHRWYRWFNEAPVLMLLAVVVLVVVKPF
jgi:putative membrane protein